MHAANDSALTKIVTLLFHSLFKTDKLFNENMSHEASISFLKTTEM